MKNGQFQAYPKYRDSDRSWLGAIPEHWQSSRVKYVATFQVGWTPPTKSDANFNGDNLWANISDLKSRTIFDTAKRISNSAAKAASMSISPKGSLLYSFKLSVGTVSFAGNDMFTNEAIASFLRSSKLPLSFLYYALPCFVIKNASTNIYGARILNQELIKSSEILRLDYSEADQIAKFLDHETAKIDRLIEKQQTLIALLKEKRQAVISHAVTKGLDPNAPMKDSGVEWLGEVPEHWVVNELKFCARSGYKTFIDGDWVEAPFITDEGVRLLQTGNVGIGDFREKGFRYISERSFQALNCTEVESGDVLICRLDGPVGRACLAPDLGVKMITSVDNAILKCSRNHDAQFLVYALSSNEWLDWIQNLCRAGGGFRFRISRSMLGNQRIPIPPAREQIEISRHLNSSAIRFLDLMEKASSQITLLQERRTALISAAVTGKIDVRDWQAPDPSPEEEAAA